MHVCCAGVGASFTSLCQLQLITFDEIGKHHSRHGRTFTITVKLLCRLLFTSVSMQTFYAEQHKKHFKYLVYVAFYRQIKSIIACTLFSLCILRRNEREIRNSLACFGRVIILIICNFEICNFLFSFSVQFTAQWIFTLHFVLLVFDSLFLLSCFRFCFDHEIPIFTLKISFTLSASVDDQIVSIALTVVQTILRWVDAPLGDMVHVLISCFGTSLLCDWFYHFLPNSSFTSDAFHVRFCRMAANILALSIVF